MADKTIGELPVASELYDDSLLVVEQSGEARSIQGVLVAQFAKDSVQADEILRQEAEAARVEAEKERQEAEAERVAAEKSRVTAESGRVSAEKARVSAESSRVTAENAREESIAKALADAQKAVEIATQVNESSYITDDDTGTKYSYAIRAKGGVPYMDLNVITE